MPDAAPLVTLAATPNGPSLSSEAWLARPLRLRVEAVAAGGLRSALGEMHRLRLAHYALDYFPFAAGGFHLSIGAGKERSYKAALHAFNLQGETTFSGGGFGARSRRLAPFAGIGFDRLIDASTRFSLEGGVRMGRRDGASSQLVRLAALGSRSGMLAAAGAGFGPVVRLSFLHSF